MLTARDEEPDRVAGLELGADDYVPKPFSPRELAARIKAILRRAEQRDRGRGARRAATIVLRRDSHDVTVDGDAVELTGKEFDLLACFLEHPGHRALARAAARPRLGDDVPRRHAHGRRPRRAAAAQARRPGDDPHRARRRVQARRGVSCADEPPRAALPRDRADRRSSASRSRSASASCSRAARSSAATLQDVAHQAGADRCSAERDAVSPLTHLPSSLQPYLERQHERYQLDAPASCRRRRRSGLRTARPRKGSVTIDGTPYFFAAAAASSGRTLRPAAAEERRRRRGWTPFVYGAPHRRARRRGARSRPSPRSCSRAASRGPSTASPRRAAASRAARIPSRCRSRAPPSSRRSPTAFNDLAEQLARAREAERTFLLSVSHELKTPLTAIRGYAEALAGRRGRSARRRGDGRRRGRAARAARRATCSTSRG